MSKRTSTFFLVVGLLVCLLLVVSLAWGTFYFAWRGGWFGIVAVFVAHWVGYLTHGLK